jgi:hypothetical protein
MARRPKQEPVLPDVPDEWAGADPHALRMPPGKVTSHVTGREKSYSSVLEEYRMSIDSVPVLEEGLVGGLWDHEQEARMRSAAGCRVARAPERYDASQMRAFADATSSEFTDLELQVYAMFWVGKLSYGQIGRRLGKDKARIRECVQRLKARADKLGYDRPDYVWRR